ncbi:MAG TPA: hypothetical protein PKK00_02085 [Bacteroidales bacterium]|nr:hypothetical protein [Bacteroidales bacterium]HPS15783.1 hypothetical protein [Bacteroidales bacterium]
MKKKMRIFLLTVTILTSIVLQPGCKKDHGDVPTIPPKSAFVMEFSALDSNNTGGKFFGKVDSVGQYSNYLFAAGNVCVWNVIINVGLAVPVASFVHAFGYQAEWNNSADCWEWKYDYTVITTYSAKLQAKVTGNTVHWEMYISKQNDFQDFLWYSGDSQLDNTEGTWTLYDNPISNKELLGIVWHKDDINGTADITYTNIVPGGAENGGYISYGITTDTTYNAYYNIYNKGKNNLTSIKWNVANKNGQVSDSLHFGDNVYHCWDENYMNTNCQ